MYARVLDVCSVVCLRALEVSRSYVEESNQMCYQESAEAYFTTCNRMTVGALCLATL